MKDGHLKPWSTINKTMVAAALLMLIFGSLDVAFGLRHNLDAFVYQFAKGVRPEDEFARISKWLNVMKFANYSAQTFIGDGILVSVILVIRSTPSIPCSRRSGVESRLWRKLGRWQLNQHGLPSVVFFKAC